MAAYNTTADSTTVTIDGDFPTADADPYALPAPVTRSVDDYAGLITPWQSTKARFVATVRASVAPFCDAQAVTASLPAAFDIDLAIGAQLDIVGQWVGRTRFVPTPIPSVFFTLDNDTLGFDQGYWDGPYDSAAGVSRLSDDDYRRLLFAKVIANSWDGTADGAVAILRSYFIDPATQVFINDGGRAVRYAPDIPPSFSFDIDGLGFDQGNWSLESEYPPVPDAVSMSYSVCLAGKLPSVIDLYLLGSDLIPVKAMGLDVDYCVTSVDSAPLFGFDMDDDEVSGFDVGAWGTDPFTAAALIAA